MTDDKFTMLESRVANLETAMAQTLHTLRQTDCEVALTAKTLIFLGAALLAAKTLPQEALSVIAKRVKEEAGPEICELADRFVKGLANWKPDAA